MPYYTYQFSDGTRIEVKQSIHDEPLEYEINPTNCRTQRVKRVYAPFGIVLRGPGFARNS